jgi:MFS family permease
VQRLLPVGQAGWLVNAISLLLVAPFVFFAPLTGWLADRHARRYVVSATLLVAGCRDDRALRRGVPALPASRRRGFFLLGLQSAIMSLRGFAKELPVKRRLDGTIQNVHSLSNRRRSLSN